MIMMLNTRQWFSCTTTFLCSFCLWLSGCNQGSPPSAEKPLPTVTVAHPVTKSIVEWDAYSGRLEAIDFVEIRARVSGYLTIVDFDEGAVVNAGDVLCVIDPRPYVAELNGANAALGQAESQLQQAQAGLESAKAKQQQSAAQLQLTDQRVKRARQLTAQNAGSEEELDQREAEFLQAEADIEASKAGISSAQATIATATAAIESAKAGVETAKLNLTYTEVRAPITGRISRQYVNQGNLISGGTASSTLLTTITSVNRIYCTFDANEQDVLKYTRLALAGKRESSRVAKNPVFLGLVDEPGFPHRGHMDFVDNRFDANTASMRARCIFYNDDQVLVPGMFARIRIPGSASYEGVLIPDSAIGTDQSSQYVYVVIDSKVQQRAIKPGPIIDGLRVVREGLTGKESVIIEGLLQARPGMIVQTKDGAIDIVEDGLPNEYEPVQRDEWILPRGNSKPEIEESSGRPTIEQQEEVQ